MFNDLPVRIRNKILIDPMSNCWNWIAGKMQGYGWTTLGSRQLRAHQLTYHLLIGPVPKDKILHHTCENRACCNPIHLEIVTRKKHLEKHPVTPKTHCKNGHPLSGENLYRSPPNVSHPHGQRCCRICTYAAQQRHNPKRRTGRPSGYWGHRRHSSKLTPSRKTVCRLLKVCQTSLA